MANSLATAADSASKKSSWLWSASSSPYCKVALFTNSSQDFYISPGSITEPQESTNRRMSHPRRCAYAQSAVEEEKNMRLRILLLVLLAIGAVPLAAAPMEFFTHIGNFEQTPTGSPGNGFAFVTIDPDAHNMRVEIGFGGLLGLVTA